MAEQTTQGDSNSQGASGQSSSSSSGQSSQQTQQSGAQSGASGQSQQNQQSQSSGQQQQAPQRPSYVLDSEWDSGSNTVRQDVFGQRVSDLMARDAEAAIRKNSLPAAPDKYEVKLPANFQAPQGVTFEFNMNDPAIAEARKIAHARGIDQETFSDMLGVYAATKIGEQTHVATARAAELSKLGSAGPQRIEALSTWLKGRVGSKAEVLVNQLHSFPHAQLVESLEEIARQFSHQGGAQYQNGGRTQEETAGKIPGYENMNFKERRVAQMQRQMAGGSGR